MGCVHANFLNLTFWKKRDFLYACWCWFFWLHFDRKSENFNDLIITDLLLIRKADYWNKKYGNNEK